MDVSVVVPVYNSEVTLPDLAARIRPVLEGLGGKYELILVNDGSRDGSQAAILSLAKQENWIRAIELMRNFGQHNALLCGVRAARYGICVTLDDDLQHPPEEIPMLLAKLGEGFDVVYGSPKVTNHSFWRGAASFIVRKILQLALGLREAGDASAFRAFRTQVREAFASYDSPFVSLDVLLSWGTTRFSSVKVRHDPRRVGHSNYSVRKLFRHALEMVTGYTSWPLRLASIMGFACAILGVLVLFYVVGRYLIAGGSVPGFPFLASIIAIFSGVQLFSLGIIGEYLGRIHFRSMGRPSYAIQSSVPALSPAPHS